MTTMTAEEWNKTYRVGQPVRYWPGTKKGPGKFGEAASKALELADGTPVVVIYEARGRIPLEHVEPVTKEETRNLQGWIGAGTDRSVERGMNEVTSFDPFGDFANEVVSASALYVEVKDTDTGETRRFEIVKAELKGVES